MNPSHPIFGVPPRYRENGATIAAEANNTEGFLLIMARTDSMSANRIAGQPNTTAGHQLTNQSPCLEVLDCDRMDNLVDLFGFDIPGLGITLISDK